MIKISVRELESVLVKEKVPKEEISKILANIDKMDKLGIASRDKEIVIQNLMKDPILRANFAKDYTSAGRVVGVNPCPVP